jgi:DNA-binding NtrC family response regulator
MSRLDARVQVELTGKAHYINNSRQHSESVIIKELSLGGALVHGISDCSDYVNIKSRLLNGKELELAGEIIRFEKGAAGLELYNSDMGTLEKIWESIRDSVASQSNCPYCGTKKSPLASFCSSCSKSLDFKNENYLQNHFRNTFLDRLNYRIGKLDLGQLEKIKGFVDKEVLRNSTQAQEEEIVGSSPAMLEIFSMIKKVAPTDVNVLIQGESGTGKELTARALHRESPRKAKPFVAMNSAEIPENLLDAVLFGDENGSAPGIGNPKKGKFEQAAGGTLFLDEVGDLPAALQIKLLHFLKERTIESIGLEPEKKVDVRIIAATNCMLKEMTQKGMFRSDLYFRLDGFTINLPPLRSRGEDKVILARHVLNKLNRDENTPKASFSLAAIDIIRSYDWPGNVRELINKVRRGQLMAAGGEIQPADMDLQIEVGESGLGVMKQEVANTQKQLVEKVLRENNYVISRSSKALGISRPSLYALMKKFNISKPSRDAEQSD